MERIAPDQDRVELQARMGKLESIQESVEAMAKRLVARIESCEVRVSSQARTKSGLGENGWCEQELRRKLSGIEDFFDQCNTRLSDLALSKICGASKMQSLAGKLERRLDSIENRQALKPSGAGGKGQTAQGLKSMEARLQEAEMARNQLEKLGGDLAAGIENLEKKLIAKAIPEIPPSIQPETVPLAQFQELSRRCETVNQEKSELQQQLKTSSAALRVELDAATKLVEQQKVELDTLKKQNSQIELDAATAMKLVEQQRVELDTLRKQRIQSELDAAMKLVEQQKVESDTLKKQSSDTKMHGVSESPSPVKRIVQGMPMSKGTPFSPQPLTRSPVPLQPRTPVPSTIGPVVRPLGLTGTTGGVVSARAPQVWTAPPGAAVRRIQTNPEYLVNVLK